MLPNPRHASPWTLLSFFDAGFDYEHEQQHEYEL